MPTPVGFGFDPFRNVGNQGLLMDELRRRGLFGSTDPIAEQVQPQRRPGGGIGGALNRLITGADSPGLSDEQNRSARRDAFTQAGLATLMASQPGASGGVLGALAQGISQGQMAGQMGRLAMGREEAIKGIVGSGQITRDKLRELFAQAVMSGDPEMAQSIATVVQAVESAERPRPTGVQRIRDMVDPETGKPATFLINEDGSTVRIGEPLPTATARAPSLTNIREVEQDGMKVLMGFNPTTGRMERVQGVEPVPLEEKAPVGSEGERKAAAFLALVPRAKDDVDSIVSAPGRIEQALSDSGIREFTDAEQQRLTVAGSALAEAWLRMTTGAAYNEREFRNAFSMFVPQPGDRKETLEIKRKNREDLMRMLRTGAGRLSGSFDEEPGAAPPGGVNPTDPFADLPNR